MHWRLNCRKLLSTCILYVWYWKVRWYYGLKFEFRKGYISSSDLKDVFGLLDETVSEEEV